MRGVAIGSKKKAELVELVVRQLEGKETFVNRRMHYYCGNKSTGQSVVNIKTSQPGRSVNNFKTSFYL